MTTPHLAGNSLGGWVALELAAIRPVASVTSPAVATVKMPVPGISHTGARLPRNG